MNVLIIILAIVDVCALVVGLTILKRVTKIVHSKADDMNTVINGAIDEAKTNVVAEFTNAVGPALTNAITTLLPIVTEYLEGRASVSTPPISIKSVSVTDNPNDSKRKPNKWGPTYNRDSA